MACNHGECANQRWAIHQATCARPPTRGTESSGFLCGPGHAQVFPVGSHWGIMLLYATAVRMYTHTHTYIHTLHYRLDYIILQYITLQYITSQYITSQYITSQYITSQSITLHTYRFYMILWYMDVYIHHLLSMNFVKQNCISVVDTL